MSLLDKIKMPTDLDDIEIIFSKVRKRISPEAFRLYWFLFETIHLEGIADPITQEELGIQLGGSDARTPELWKSKNYVAKLILELEKSHLISMSISRGSGRPYRYKIIDLGEWQKYYDRNS